MSTRRRSIVSLGISIPSSIEERHAEVGLGRADAVDAGDAGHDDHVAPLEEADRVAEWRSLSILSLIAESFSI